MKLQLRARVKVRYGAIGQLTGRQAEGKDGVIADRPGRERQNDEHYFVRFHQPGFGHWFDWFDGADLGAL